MAGQDAIERLHNALERLRIEYERFFAGAIPVPPESERERIKAQIRRLRGKRFPSAVEQFRLTGLEARFNSFNELFNRRMRDHESARNQRAAAKAAEDLREAAEGVVVEETASEETLDSLYQALYPEDGGQRPDMKTFRSFLDAQTEKIRLETGCEEVRFRIADEGGRPRLKAKPIRKGVSAR